MQCTNCGRQLNDQAVSAGFCPSCGIPVAAMQPAPAPMATPAPAPVMVEETRVAYSDSATGEAFVADAITVTQDALPPIDAPAMAAEAVEPPAVTAPVTPPSEPAPVTPPAAPSVEAMPSLAYPQGMMPSATTPAAPIAAASSNRTGLLVGIGIPALVVVALIVLYLLGKGAHVGPLAGFFVASATATATLVPTATTATTSTPTAAPTVAVPAPATGFQTFQSPDGTYGLNYPSTWLSTGQTVQGINAQAFLTPDLKNIFLVAPTTQTVAPSSYVTLAQSLAGALGVTNITQTGQPTSVKLGANTWHKVTGTLTFQNTPYTATILGNDRPAGTFVLVYLAPTASFATAEKTNFLVMATSLTFGM